MARSRPAGQKEVKRSDREVTFAAFFIRKQLKEENQKSDSGNGMLCKLQDKEPINLTILRLSKCTHFNSIKKINQLDRVMISYIFLPEGKQSYVGSPWTMLDYIASVDLS